MLSQKFKWIGMILLLCLVLPSALTLGSYQKNTEIDLKFPFEVNGSAASSNAVCNVSIQYQNSSYTFSSSGTCAYTWNANMTMTATNWEIYKEDGYELVINSGGSIR